MTATITEHPTQTVETATTAQATATNTQAEANRLTFAVAMIAIMVAVMVMAVVGAVTGSPPPSWPRSPWAWASTPASTFSRPAERRGLRRAHPSPPPGPDHASQATQDPDPAQQGHRTTRLRGQGSPRSHGNPRGTAQSGAPFLMPRNPRPRTTHHHLLVRRRSSTPRQTPQSPPWPHYSLLDA